MKIGAQRLFLIMFVISIFICTAHYLTAKKSCAQQLASIDQTCKSVDLIVFSYDRPMQLYALLESIGQHMTGINSIAVIYRVSNDKYLTAYDVIRNRFDSVIFLRQGQCPEKDFKPLVLEAFCHGTSPYICYAVDDIIIKNDVDMCTCTHAMEQYSAYGFFLRLGTHLDYCYSLSQYQALPRLIECQEGIVSWAFSDGTCDWQYPHTLDMTIYRKKDIFHQFTSLEYTNPNNLEARWAKNAFAILDKKALCFTISAIVNIPINRVQNTYNNPHMNAWTCDQLLDMFNTGLKINISMFNNMLNESCHSPCVCNFIQR